MKLRKRAGVWAGLFALATITLAGIVHTNALAHQTSPHPADTSALDARLPLSVLPASASPMERGVEWNNMCGPQLLFAAIADGRAIGLPEGGVNVEALHYGTPPVGSREASQDVYYTEDSPDSPRHHLRVTFTRNAKGVQTVTTRLPDERA